MFIIKKNNNNHKKYKKSILSGLSVPYFEFLDKQTAENKTVLTNKPINIETRNESWTTRENMK